MTPENLRLSQNTHLPGTKSNGQIENAVSKAEEQCRAIRLSTEQRLQIKLPVRHPLHLWLVKHACDVYTKFSVGHDGMTPYRRLKGKECTEEHIEFGEVVLYKKRKGQVGKFAPQWDSGIWVGRRWGTGENIVINEDKVIHPRSIRRKPESERWNKERVAEITALPWEAAHDSAPPALQQPEFEEKPKIDVAPEFEDADIVPRTFRIMHRDLIKYGYTPGCKVCDLLSKNRSTIGRNHSTQCRKRLEEALTNDGDPRVARAKLRQDEYLASKGPSAHQDEGGVGDDDASGNKDNTTDDNEMHIDSNTGSPQESSVARADEPMDTDDLFSDTQNMLMSIGILNKNVHKEADKIRRVLLVCGGDKPTVRAKVMEIYSPPRVTAAARKHIYLNIEGGMSFDLRADENGIKWDFTQIQDRARARRKIHEEKPFCVIGSPPCTDFCILNQNINHPKMDPDEVKRRMVEARLHLQFCIEIYQHQLDYGRHFLHEHPASATSWQEKLMLKLLSDERTYSVIGDMCQFGLTTTDAHGVVRPALKPTRFLTSCIAIANRLNRRCPRKHKHAVLLGGRAAAAARYTDKLCIEILRGVQEQYESERGCIAKRLLDNIEREESEVQESSEARRPKDEPPEEANDVECYEWEFEGDCDTTSGEQLPARLVNGAKQDEIKWLKNVPVYTKVPIAQCWERTGKAPIGVKWVITNKGDRYTYDIRARLVATEINRYKDDQMYAPTPPLEAKKMLFSWAARRRRNHWGETEKLLFVDVKKAYFNAVPVREVYVKLPPEDYEEGMCGILHRCLYGTRDAAACWEMCYTKALVEMGFKQGKGSPCCFWNETRSVKCVVHGDDFTVLGGKSQLEWFSEELAKHFEIKIRGVLGDNKDEVPEIRILNRIIRWTSDGIEYEADQRHAEIIVKEMGLASASSVNSPGVKRTAIDGVLCGSTQQANSRELSPEFATKYRQLGARANYLATDRVDIAFAAKEICRDMSKPTEESWTRLKRLGRYLRGMPRLIEHFPTQECNHLRVYADSDWAGCIATRKSTSGGVAMLGNHQLKHWSTTQGVIALSSAEAELYGIVKAAVQGMGLISVARDLGEELTMELLTDSSAAKGVCNRKGLGKVRHLDTNLLWVQDKVKNGDLIITKINGENNPADLFTKYLDHTKINEFVGAIGCSFRIGRAQSAPSIETIVRTQ